MDKKAQTGPIGAVMLFGVFLVMWFVFLGKWVSDVGQMAVNVNHLTGIEAFAFNNLNVLIFVVILLAVMSWGYFTSQ